ncbi:HAD-IA family hydrolase [Glaciihabitans sp. UYNi722]|uniref:HAD-IA family hydrolase n=1 Tax=Glaciihabitans sp. UYNi722 TaxID=3156344 RepID=UPI00339205BE
MDLYFFDFDKTLYAYNFRMRLPALSLVTGSSQYHLAKTWWAGGFEKRAEAGEWNTSEEYLAEFERVTGAHLTLENWQEARALASTRIPASLDALALASTFGTTAVLSNNPSPFAESLPVLASDVTKIVGENRLVSCQLGVRKPDPKIYRLALDHLGVRAEDAFFADDSAENIAGAASLGITGHQLVYLDGVPQTDALHEAIERFAHRNN